MTDRIPLKIIYDVEGNPTALGEFTTDDLIPAIYIPASVNGQSPELQNNGTHIQWRYVGDPAWINLVALADLMPTTESLVADVVTAIGNRLLPAGGLTDDVLKKLSGTDYDVDWVSAGPAPVSSRIIAVSYNPSTDLKSWRYYDTADLTTPVAIDVGFAGTFTGDNGRTGLNRVGEVVIFSPNSADYAFSLSTVTLGVAAADNINYFFSYGGSIYLSPDGQYISTYGFSYLNLGLAEDFSFAPGTGTNGALNVSGASSRYGTAFSPDSSLLYQGNSTGVRIYETANPGTFTNQAVSGGLRGFALNADGTIASGGSLTAPGIYDTTTWALLNTVPSGLSQGPQYDQMYIFHPTDPNILIARCNPGADPASAKIFFMDNFGSPISLVPNVDSGATAGACNSSGFNSDGSKLYLGCYSGVHVYDTSDWSYIESFAVDGTENNEIIVI